MNIYLSPDAIKSAMQAYRSDQWTSRDAVEAACRALIQHIVENPRELSQEERVELAEIWADVEMTTVEARQEVFNATLRLAFTPPTPDVPEKIVELIDEFDGKQAWTTDDVREFAVNCYEAGMAVAK